MPGKTFAQSSRRTSREPRRARPCFDPRFELGIELSPRGCRPRRDRAFSRSARHRSIGTVCSGGSLEGGIWLKWTPQVEAVWTNASGGQSSLVLLPGVLGAGNSWLPTLPLLQCGGALNALTLKGLTTEMSFRFTPRAGLFGAGNWRIDDVYVDPWKTI